MQRRKGFTLIELLVVIAIIAILAAILFPVFAQARDKARQTTCLSNCKQVALGFMMYFQDFDEQGPIGYDTKFAWPNSYWWYWWQVSWTNLIEPYVKNRQVFLCPSGAKVTSLNPYNIPSNYCANYWVIGAQWGFSMAAFDRPAEIINITERADNPTWENYYATWPTPGTPPTWAAGNLSRVAWTRHQQGCNYSFLDGHAKWMRDAQGQKIEHWVWLNNSAVDPRR